MGRTRWRRSRLWTLKVTASLGRWTGDDAGDFTIIGGVLAFAAPPDFENGQGSGTSNNTYEITVDASDGTDSDTEDVEIEVTNVDEPGTVTLSTLQPQVEVELTATLSDSDVEVSSTPTWMWFRGSSVIAGAVGTTYTPMPGDVGSILKAKATYMDGEDAENDKTAEAVLLSMRSVRSLCPPAASLLHSRTQNPSTPVPRRDRLGRWRRTRLRDGTSERLL